MTRAKTNTSRGHRPSATDSGGHHRGCNDAADASEVPGKNGDLLGQARARLVERLAVRRDELVQAIFVAAREQVPEPAVDDDPDLVGGLHAAVTEVMAYSLEMIAADGHYSGPLPQAAVMQARRAARAGAGLTTVVLRYAVGYRCLEQFVVEEVGRMGIDSELHRDLSLSVSSARGALLQGLLEAITDEYTSELEIATGSREQRRAELVHALLAGAEVSSEELGYPLDATHLALIVAGERAQEAVRRLAAGVGCELLSVARGEETVWAWLGGDRDLASSKLEALVEREPFTRVSIAIGELASGADGFRLTHRQAQAARLVAQRRPAPVTRYADVPFEGLALQDETLARSLIQVCLGPLETGGGQGAGLRETLRAYFRLGYNAGSAASALGVDRSTVRRRIAEIERRLGCPIRERHTELDIALRLEALLAAPS